MEKQPPSRLKLLIVSELPSSRSRKKPKDPEKLAEHKEVLELCKQHIEECENLERRKQTDAYTSDRVELLSGGGHGGVHYNGRPGEEDPFTHTDLPDIDVEEDLKNIRNKNKEIDQDLDDLGAGVARLKEIALDMGNV